jgi:ActR/RegA family two-component response regulator
MRENQKSKVKTKHPACLNPIKNHNTQPIQTNANILIYFHSSGNKHAHLHIYIVTEEIYSSKHLICEDIMQRDGKIRSNGVTHDDAFTQNNDVFTTLVIENESTFSEFLKEFFQTEGHFILRANNAEEALEMTRKYYPDLILLNRDIIGSNSLSFLTELLLEHPSAAIIKMATNPSFSEGVEAIKLGAVDYLERPLDPLKLKKAIDLQKALYDIL